MSNLTNKRKWRKKVPEKPQPIPARLGDGLGNLIYDAGANLYLARVAGQIQVVFNDQVPPKMDLQVDVGRQLDGSDNPGVFKVLSTRSAIPGGLGNGAQLGYAPSSRYGWSGQDPLMIHARQILPLRVGPATGADMTVFIYPGPVWNGTAEVMCAYQTADLTAHIPSTAGKAALVLMTVNYAGVLVATKGAEFTLADMTTADLMLANLPAAPSGTSYISAAVRVYTGQTAVKESRITGTEYTDVTDLRFSGVFPNFISDVTTTGDFKAVGTGTNGLILYDTVLAAYYRVTLTNGALVITAV